MLGSGRRTDAKPDHGSYRPKLCCTSDYTLFSRESLAEKLLLCDSTLAPGDPLRGTLAEPIGSDVHGIGFHRAA